MSNILYKKLRQQISLDGGATWNYVYNAYKVGDILENPSNCTSSDSKQYRWVELPISEGYTCDPTYTKYTIEVEEVSNNGGLTWTRTGNQRKANVYEENSVDCGFECNEDELMFYHFGDVTFRINNIQFTAEYTRTDTLGQLYRKTLEELGIDEFVSAEHMFNQFGDEFNSFSNPMHVVVSIPCTLNVTNMRYMFANCKSLYSINTSDIITSNVTNMSHMFHNCNDDEFTCLDVSHFNTSKVTDMSSMFDGCEWLKKLDVSNFNTSNVTDMNRMFYGCSGLTSLDVSNWDTSKVTDMSDMFHDCEYLTSLDVSKWNTSNVTNMDGMFFDCYYLKYLDVSNWDISNVTSAESMFGGLNGFLKELVVNSSDYQWWCSRLSESYIDCDIITPIFLPNTSGDTSDSGSTSGDTSECYNKTLSFEFSGSSMTYKLNETTYTATTSPYKRTFATLGIDTLTSCKETFSGTNITKLTSFPCTDNVTTMEDMFYHCSGLTSVDVSDWNTSNVTSMDAMFNNCQSLTSLDVSNFNTYNVTDMGYMFQSCTELTSLDVSSFDTSNVTDMTAMFSNCQSLTSLDVSNFDTSKLTDMIYMFSYCSGLTELDVSNFNTSNVTNMYHMFYYCRGLTSLDISNWNMTNVTDTTDMFKGCTSLTSITMCNCNQTTIDKITSALTDVGLENKVTIITDCSGDSSGSTSGDTTECSDRLSFEFSGSSMVYDLNNKSYTASTSPYSITLEELGIDTLTNCYAAFSGTNITKLTEFPCTDNVTIMSEMFWDCSGLTSLDLSSFNTSNVTSMNFMFNRCSGLTSLDVSNFDTSNVTSMYYMFKSCNKLTTIDVSNFDTSNVTDMNEMFSGCKSLTSLDLSSFNTSNVTEMSNMFYNCTSLTELDLSNWDTSKVIDTFYMSSMFSNCTSLSTITMKNCNQTTIDKITEALTEAGILEQVTIIT